MGHGRLISREINFTTGPEAGERVEHASARYSGRQQFQVIPRHRGGRRSDTGVDEFPTISVTIDRRPQ